MKKIASIRCFITVFLILSLSTSTIGGQTTLRSEDISNKQIKVFNNLKNNGFTEYVFTLKVFLYDSLNDTFTLNSSDFSISISAKYFIGGYSYKLYDSAGLFLSTVFPFTISGIPILEIQSWFRGEFINGPISIKAVGWGFGQVIIRIHAD